jgi:hypothetical protein
MPWRLKREIWLLVLGCAVIVLSLIVAGLNTSKGNIEALAWAGFAGGLAIVVNTLPANGRKDTDMG